MHGRAAQFTLARPTHWVRGIGLFTQAEAAVRFLPSDAPGISFRTGDVSFPAVVAHAEQSASVPNTTLRAGAACIRTVEHALSALAGLSVWSCTIEVEGPEIPILDGSSLAFIEAIHAAGLSPIAHPIAPLAPAREHLIHDGKGGSLRILPARSPRFEYLLAYPEGSGIQPQTAAWDGDPATYAASVAPARTFSTKAQAEAARAAGMFTRFSPRDLLVIDTDGTPIDNALRFPDEPARHKLLDLVGDLALLGRPLRAHVIAERTGHATTRELCRMLLS